MNDFIDTLTHELTHQIYIQNYDKIEKYWDYLTRKYKNESIITINHIPLHAKLKSIYLNLYKNRIRLNRDIKGCNKWKDYRRAWEIVEEEGHENIISEFRKRIK